MLVVQIVRHRGVHLVPLGPLAGLVATDQQDGASARVEREQDSQCAVLAGSQAVEQDPRPRVIATVYLIAKDQAFLLDQGEMHFVELQRIRTHRNQGKDGRYRWYQGSVTDLSDDPAVEGLVLTAHDVTAQKAIEDRLAHQATHDPLTRLPNRVIVNDRLGHALARGRRDGSRAAAIFLDIDEFKRINDTWGHAAGDELLREVAHRVQRAARAADTVGRYGGDEFVVICEDLPSVADALLVAERIRDVRSELRARKGWIMDTYLLRRPLGRPRG